MLVVKKRKDQNNKKKLVRSKRQPLHVFMHGLFAAPRGYFNMHPRQKFFVVADSTLVLNNAVAGDLYDYAYLNLSNPIKCFNGGATSVWQWSILGGLMRKYIVTHAIVILDVVNQETTGVTVALGPVDYLPPNNTAQAKLTLAQPQTQVKVAAGVGSINKIRLEIAVDFSNYGGFNPLNAEDLHWGGLNPAADPFDNIYAHVCVDTGGVASVNGLFTNIRVGFFGIAAEFNESF